MHSWQQRVEHPEHSYGSDKNANKYFKRRGDRGVIVILEKIEIVLTWAYYTLQIFNGYFAPGGYF